MRNYNFTSSTLFRLREYKDKLKEQSEFKKEQGRKDLERRKEELKKQQQWNREKREREKLQKSNLPIGTPNVSSEVIASQPDQNVVGSTGLTATETAWLSNEEKAMRLKSKGLA